MMVSVLLGTQAGRGGKQAGSGGRGAGKQHRCCYYSKKAAHEAAHADAVGRLLAEPLVAGLKAGGGAHDPCGAFVIVCAARVCASAGRHRLFLMAEAGQASSANAVPNIQQKRREGKGRAEGGQEAPGSSHAASKAGRRGLTGDPLDQRPRKVAHRPRDEHREQEEERVGEARAALTLCVVCVCARAP